MINISVGVRELLNVLCSGENFEINELQFILKKSKRMIYYYMDQINDIFNIYEAKIIHFENGKYFLDDVQINLVAEIYNKGNLIFNINERLDYYFILLVSSSDKITLETLINNFNVSKNVVLTDLRLLRKKLNEFDIKLISHKYYGYTLDGNIYQIRNVYLEKVNTLINSIGYKKLKILDLNIIDYYIYIIQKIFSKLKTQVYQNEIILSAFLLYAMHNRKLYSNVDFLDYNFSFVFSSKELSLVDKYLNELSNNERIYFAIHLIILQKKRDIFNPKEDLQFLKLATKLVDLYEYFSFTKFANKDTLIKSIYLHLQLSFNQYFYSIPSINPLIKDIQNKYAEVYEITKKCCLQLEKEFPYPIFDSEIAYLTTNFLAYLNQVKKANRDLKVLLVCLNTTAGSLLLKNELEKYYPMITIKTIIKPNEIFSYDFKKIDLIISTIKIKINKPVVIVNPILTKKDKTKLNAILYEYTGKSNIMSILHIIRDNVDNNTFTKIKNQILNKFDLSESQFEYKKYRLLNLLSYKTIKIFNEFLNWEDAIKKGSKILLDKKIIDNTYINKMISFINEFGPYIVIGNKVAIAHASPEYGAKMLGLTLSILKKGVKIKDKDIYLLFILSTPDNNIHLSVLKDIYDISNDIELIKKIYTSKSKKNILELLDKKFN